MNHSKVNVSCNMCGCNHTDLLYLKNGLRVVKCRVCDLVYLNPRSEKDAEAREGEKGPIAPCGANLERERIIFERRILEIQRLKSKPGRLLDVGCGSGGFMAFARDCGWSVVGVDPNEAAAEHARANLGLEVVNGTLEELPPSTGLFDMVTFWDVLEHAPDPMGLIKIAQSRLAEGGLIGITVSNISSLAAWVGGTGWYALRDVHLTFFTPETLRKMVTLAGFDVIRIETEGLGIPRVGGWIGFRVVEGAVNAILDLLQVGEEASLYAGRK